MAVHHVYLIPGFFGFSNLGGILYFRAVRDILQREFAARGVAVEIHEVKTLPTGSLARRAGRVLETIGQFGGHDEASDVHLIGHSTGGLDARLVGSHARGLGPEAVRASLAPRLRTLVCLSTPHFGTPLANFFTTIYGKQLLYFITLLVFVGLWRRPISIAGGLLSLGYRVYDLLGLSETMLRQITNQLLRDFTPEREREVRRFLDSVLDDVSLMMQLTPETMDVLNATIEPLPEVRCVSYGTVSPPPMQSLRRARLRELLDPLPAMLYSTVYTLTARPERGYAYHPAFDAREFSTGAELPEELTPASNDGVVPALSQVFGEFRGFVRADHLDVVGHYLRGPGEKQDGADWFLSGADFSRERFELLWRDVVRVLLREA